MQCSGSADGRGASSRGRLGVVKCSAVRCQSLNDRAADRAADRNSARVSGGEIECMNGRLSHDLCECLFIKKITLARLGHAGSQTSAIWQGRWTCSDPVPHAENTYMFMAESHLNSTPLHSPHLAVVEGRMEEMDMEPTFGYDELRPD